MRRIQISAGVSVITETGVYGSPEIPKDSGHRWIGLLIRNCMSVFCGTFRLNETFRVSPGFFIFKLIMFYWEIVKNVIVIFNSFNF